MSDTTPSRFFGLDINSPFTWPGHPPLSRVVNMMQGLTSTPPTGSLAGDGQLCVGANAVNAAGTDFTRPMAFQGNPKFYYKWMRMIPRTNSGWNRNIYLPAGSTTPIMLDRVFSQGGGESGETLTSICAWTLFISRPENYDCTITTYDVIDPSTVAPIDTTDSDMIRANYAPNSAVQQFNCQDGGHLELTSENARALETWNMSQGSVVFSTGNYYFSIANNSTVDQTIVTLGSFNNYDLADVLQSPVVTTHRPFQINWSPN